MKVKKPYFGNSSKTLAVILKNDKLKLFFRDLDGMRKTAVRTAYNDSELPPDFCYLKIDVEKRYDDFSFVRSLDFIQRFGLEILAFLWCIKHEQN